MSISSGYIIREIIPLSESDCFYIADRHKNEFVYPLHSHKEFELNYIENAEGVRRIVGDSVEIIVGVVGVLQFDVLKYRLENEYNVEIRLEPLPYEHIRWIENKEIDLNKLVGTSDMKKIKDMKGNPLLLFVNHWSVGMTLDRNEGMVLYEFGRN